MTSIEWCQNADGSEGKSWNPIRAVNKKTGRIGHYCEHVNEACRFCYAEKLNLNARNLPFGGTGLAFKPGHLKDVEIYLDEGKLTDPLRWKKPQRVFVDSMDDPFGHWVEDEWLDRMFAVMALCPQHTFILLTKRPARARDYIWPAFERVYHRMMEMTGKGVPTIRESCATYGLPWSKPTCAEDWYPLHNVWLLVSCAEQKDADEFIPILLNTPAAKRGVSLEPLIGPVDLTHLCVLQPKPGSIRAGIHIDALAGRYCESGVPYIGAWDVDKPCPTDAPALRLDWVIVGGESGLKDQDVRPMHPRWVRKLRDDCKAAGVPFFFKQWGEWLPGTHYTDELRRIDSNLEYSIYACADWDGDKPLFRDLAPGEGGDLDDEAMWRVGKKRAGRELDDVEHNEWPAP